MKIAILGGSFNPIHIGHLALADDVCCRLGYDQVLFVPAYKPPHKIMEGEENGNDRYEMVRLACEGNSFFSPERCELDRGGVSYTYDTINTLKKKYEGQLDGKIGLVMGQELAAEFGKWYHANDIASETDIILAYRHLAAHPEQEFCNRTTGSYTGESAPDSVITSFPYPHKVLENFMLPVSSTEIRRRIARHESWRYLVPEAVYQYIIQRKLYGYN